MGSLFKRQITDELRPMLRPRSARWADTEEQTTYLKRVGFINVSSDLAASMERVGAVVARVRTDGGNWPLSRFADDSELAPMVHGGDVKAWESLRAACNVARFGGSADPSDRFEKLMAAFQATGPANPELVATVEAMVRLGSSFDAIVEAISGSAT